VARWVTPNEFLEWKRVGENYFGFRHVEAGPLVRSSYHAKEQAREVEAGPVGQIREIWEVDLTAPAEFLRNKNLVQIEARNAPAELSRTRT
jgi:lipoic acid synthetase